MIGEVPSQDPQIATILFEYYAGRDMRWADSQVALEELLGDEALVVGNLLLNTEEPLTLAEIREQLDLSQPVIDLACHRLISLMPTGGPLVFESGSDSENQPTRYQIVPATEKDQREEG